MRALTVSTYLRIERLIPLITAVAVGVLITLAAAPAAGAATTSSPGPLLWTAPGQVDAKPIDSLSCPSVALCVAVDRAGFVLWSTDPAGGPAMWQSADVDGGNELTSLSCPTTGLCVAVDAQGNAITSQNPTGGASSWTVARIDKSTTQNNTDNAGAILVRGVSCPSTSLCVAVDAAGNAVVSTAPTGGATAWTTIHIDAGVSDGCSGTGLTCQPPLVGVSCPSIALCVAVDFSGNLLTTATPTAATPWTSTPTDGDQLSSLWGLSCPVVGFCVTVDGVAGRAITLNPALPTAQFARAMPYSLYGIWCQSQSLCLASVETAGGISGLLGSFDPAAATATWSLSSLGGVSAVACPTATFCLAADDEGDVAAGLTTTGASTGLDAELLSTRRLPTIATLDRTRSETFVFTTPIAAQVKLVWTVPGAAAGASPVTVASASHSYRVPGAAKLTLRLSAAGRRLFAAAKKPVTVTATATFSASTGSVTAVSKLTFRHPPKP